MRYFAVLLLAGFASGQNPQWDHHPAWIGAFVDRHRSRVVAAFEQARAETRPVLVAAMLWH